MTSHTLKARTSLFWAFTTLSLLCFSAFSAGAYATGRVDYKALSPSMEGLSGDRSITWDHINAVQGGSITFVKEIEDKIYFGTEYGKLYSSNGLGEEKIIVSPDQINGMNDILLNEDTFFIGTDEGLYISKDDLKTWALANNKDLAKATVYNIITHGNALFTATSAGIFSSTDNGSSWEPVETASAKVSGFPSYFIASNGHTLLAASIDNTGLPQSPLIYSQDDGKSWTKVNSDFYVGSLSRQPATVINGTFYVIGLSYNTSNPNGFASVLSSSDGENWHQGAYLDTFGAFPPISHVTHDSTGRMYVTNDPYTGDSSSYPSLSTSKVVSGYPGQNNWATFDSPERPLSSLSIVNDQLLMGILHEGVLESYTPDSGAVKSVDAVTSAYISAFSGNYGYLQIIASGAVPPPYQAATFNYVNCDSNVYLYADGEKWIIHNPEKITEGEVETIGWDTAKDIESQNEKTVIVTCSGKLFYSEDGGHTTVEIKLPDHLPTSAGATVTLFNGKIYAGNQWGIYEVSNYTSGSPTMKQVKEFDQRTSVLRDFLVTEKNLYAASMGLGPLKSPDGESWGQINGGLKNATDIQSLAYNNGTVYGAGRGVYRLIDGTDTWQDISSNITQIIGNNTVSSIAVYQDSILLTVTGHGVLIGFTDGRPGWNFANSGLDTKRVNRIMIFENNAILGTEENGVYNGTFTSP